MDVNNEESLKVRDIMSKPAITIEYSKNAKQAAVTMKKHRKGFLVVIKKKNPIGVLSDTDLINRIIVKNRDPSKTKVKEIMGKPLLTINPEQDAMEAVERMKKANIHRLPVVEEGKVIGVVSLSDVAKASPDLYYLIEYRNEMKKEPVRFSDVSSSGLCDSCGNYSDSLTQTETGEWVCEVCEDETEEGSLI